MSHFYVHKRVHEEEKQLGDYPHDLVSYARAHPNRITYGQNGRKGYDLRYAKATLQLCEVVGFQEDYNGWLDDVDRIFGEMKRVEPQNVGLKKTPMMEHEQSVIDEIARINHLDMELYAYAKALKESLQF